MDFKFTKGFSTEIPTIQNKVVRVPKESSENFGNNGKKNIDFMNFQAFIEKMKVIFDVNAKTKLFIH